MNHLEALDTLIDAGMCAGINYHPSMFYKSHRNPLEVLRCLTMTAGGSCIEAEDAARITGLPAAHFESTDHAPDLTPEELERALGRLTLAWLASVRNTLAEAAGLVGREDILTAASVAALPAVPMRVAA